MKKGKLTKKEVYKWQFGAMTLSITTPSIMGLFVTLSMATICNECSAIMLSVIMLSAAFFIVILSVIMLSVVMLSVVMLDVVLLSVVMLSVVAPSIWQMSW